jgi:hypothetical protein
MSLANRVALIFQVTLVGTFIVFIIAFAYYQRAWFVPWKSLGMPPEKAVRIVSTESGELWVETISGKIYQHKYDENSKCKDKCWELSNYPESNNDTSWGECDNSYPLFINASDTKKNCNYWAPGYTVHAYVIGKEGTVYTWIEDMSEGGWFWAIPLALFYGMPASFIIALIFALIG